MLTISEGNRDKSKEKVWKRFCYLLSCKRDKSEPSDTTSDDFDLAKIDSQKWIYTYNHQGPDCEFLHIGNSICHEILTNTKKGLVMWIIGTKKRRSMKLFRKTSREIKVKKTKTAVTETFVSHKQVGTLELGRIQSVNNYLIHAEKVCVWYMLCETWNLSQNVMCKSNGRVQQQNTCQNHRQECEEWIKIDNCHLWRGETHQDPQIEVVGWNSEGWPEQTSCDVMGMYCRLSIINLSLNDLVWVVLTVYNYSCLFRFLKTSVLLAKLPLPPSVSAIGSYYWVWWTDNHFSCEGQERNLTRCVKKSE